MGLELERGKIRKLRRLVDVADFHAQGARRGLRRVLVRRTVVRMPLARGERGDPPVREQVAQILHGNAFLLSGSCWPGLRVQWSVSATHPRRAVVSLSLITASPGLRTSASGMALRDLGAGYLA